MTYRDPALCEDRWVPDQSDTAMLPTAELASGSAPSSGVPADAATAITVTSRPPSQPPMAKSHARMVRSPALSRSTPHTRCATGTDDRDFVGLSRPARSHAAVAAPTTSVASAALGDTSRANTPVSAGLAIWAASANAALSACPVRARSGPATSVHIDRAVAMIGGANVPASAAPGKTSQALCPPEQPISSSPDPSRWPTARYPNARGPRRSIERPLAGASNPDPTENAATAAPASANEWVPAWTARMMASP